MWKLNIGLLTLILLFQFVIPNFKSSLHFYIDYLFAPFQKIKTYLLSRIHFSIGDWMYLIFILIIVFSVGRFIYFLFRKKKVLLLQQGARTLFCILSVLFLIIFFWNPNYKRPKLSRQFAQWDSIKMDIDKEWALNQFLVEQFKDWDSVAMKKAGNSGWNDQVVGLYKEKFGENIPALQSKSSIFGDWIQSMGIQGYYNPISSEAQINDDIPDFLHPFVIAHELAHQMGIASEGDANFAAYYICTHSEDAFMKYSAYFNLYLYNLRKIHKADTAMAALSRANLPAFVQRDLDTLKAFNARRPYDLNKFTIPFYDFFLQFNGEQQGIQSYGGMTKYGYIYELVEKRRTHISIRPYN